MVGYGANDGGVTENADNIRRPTAGRGEAAAGVLHEFDAAILGWSTAHNPFFAGPRADGLALIPSTLICVVLHLVGRGKQLAGGSDRMRS